jgi:hypothetical protein
MTTAQHPPAAPAAVHRRLATLLAAVDGGGVRWCLLRGATELDRPGGEVDLLVHPADRARLRRAFAATGATARLAAPGRGTHAFHLAYDAAQDAWLKLDVVTELEFGAHQELKTRTAAAVLQRRRRRGAVVLPAPADAFWALLLHELLDKRALRPDRAAELAALAPAARRDDSPLAAVVEAACPAGWSTGRIVEIAAAGGAAELAPLHELLPRRWPGAGPAARCVRVARSRALRRLHRALPATGLAGASVALAGSDRAARDAAAAALARSWPVATRAVPHGGARGALACAAQRRLGRLAILDAASGRTPRADAVLALGAAGDADAARRRAVDEAFRRAAVRGGAQSTELMARNSSSRSTG